MTDPAGENPHPSRWRTRRYRVAVLLLVIGLIGSAAWWLHSVTRQRLQERLLRTAPNVVIQHADLVKTAITEARPLYSQHCARCHGADLRGQQALGTPNLTDNVWLYGTGTVFDIERTVMYGVRSGMAKTHDVTDMPAFGLTGVLAPDEIRNVVQYVLQLSGAKHDAQAALAGRQLYSGDANCADCHGPDGKGDSAYGAADLTANVWNSGGDAESLYKTIYYGQHRIMPGLMGTLSLGEIRALAVYVYMNSHALTAPRSTTEQHVAEQP